MCVCVVVAHLAIELCISFDKFRLFSFNEFYVNLNLIYRAEWRLCFIFNFRVTCHYSFWMTRWEKNGEKKNGVRYEINWTHTRNVQIQIRAKTESKKLRRIKKELQNVSMTISFKKWLLIVLHRNRFDLIIINVIINVGDVIYQLNARSWAL